MAYKRKTRDEWILLAYYGPEYGWEEVLTEDTHAEIRLRLREYRANMPQYPYRIKKHRVPIKNFGGQSPREE